VLEQKPFYPFPRGGAFALAVFLWGAAMHTIGCAAHRGANSPYVVQPGDEKVAVLILWPGKDKQAKILAFDGIPFEAFLASHARSGHSRLSLVPGEHAVRVVVPGPCTDFDGLPGPGNSLANLRFVAKAGAQYEISLDSRPGQVLTTTWVHVYELVKGPFEVRAVEQLISSEPDPSSCPRGRGMVR